MPVPQINSDSSVMLGKPVISGTRITVESLLECVSAGESPEQIQRAFPHLPEGSIATAFSYPETVDPGS